MRNIGKTFVWCQMQTACTYFLFLTYLWTNVSISSAVREAFENLKKTFDKEIADLRSQLETKSKWQMISRCSPETYIFFDIVTLIFTMPGSTVSPSFSCYRTNNHLAESKIAYSGCSVNTQGKYLNIVCSFQYDCYVSIWQLTNINSSSLQLTTTMQVWSLARACSQLLRPECTRCPNIFVTLFANIFAPWS